MTCDTRAPVTSAWGECPTPHVTVELTPIGAPSTEAPVTTIGTPVTDPPATTTTTEFTYDIGTPPTLPPQISPVLPATGVGVGGVAFVAALLIIIGLMCRPRHRTSAPNAHRCPVVDDERGSMHQCRYNIGHKKPCQFER